MRKGICMKINHKYVDYFFALFEFSIFLGCIFNLRGANFTYYRFMLAICSAELGLRRLADAIKGGEE